jgi:predicted DsbA family dithiol-disulfide isomerase
VVAGSGGLETSADDASADEAITITIRSFELHPDIPAEGSSVRPGGRLDKVFDHIAEECRERRQPFVKPKRTPNSHRILALAELVNDRHPDVFPAFDDAVAHAHWVEGRAIDDEVVVARLLGVVGLDPSLLDDVDGLGERLLAESRTDAMNAGATATPSWQINDLVVTGLHDDAQFQRWVGRILEHSG